MKKIYYFVQEDFHGFDEKFSFETNGSVDESVYDFLAEDAARDYFNGFGFAMRDQEYWPLTFSLFVNKDDTEPFYTAEVFMDYHPVFRACEIESHE